jgi:hypothetical protein
VSQTFTTFIGLLTSTSGYFARALSKRQDLKNGGQVEIEDDPQIFQLYLNYANTGRVVDGVQNSELDVEYSIKGVGMKVHNPTVPGEEGEEEDPNWPVELEEEGYADDLEEEILTFDDLVELYIFAHRRDAKGLSDMTISLMLSKISIERRLPVESLARLKDKTSDDDACAMLDMLVEIAARFVASEDFEQRIDELSTDFVVAVLGRQREIANAEAVEKGKELEYWRYYVRVGHEQVYQQKAAYYAAQVAAQVQQTQHGMHMPQPAPVASNAPPPPRRGRGRGGAAKQTQPTHQQMAQGQHANAMPGPQQQAQQAQGPHFGLHVAPQGQQLAPYPLRAPQVASRPPKAREGTIRACKWHSHG